MREFSNLQSAIGQRGFAVHYDGTIVQEHSAGLSLVTETVSDAGSGAEHRIVTYAYEQGSMNVETHSIAYLGTSAAECWVTVRNDGDEPIRIDRIDSIRLKLPKDEYELFYYTGGWGQEFDGNREPLQADFVLETRKGRSSSDFHPWFNLFGREGGMLCASAMWSGNWVFRFEADPDGGLVLSGGLHDWEFHKVLQPGESMEGIRIVLVAAAGDDLNDISVQLARIGRRHWYPSNALSASMPVEWNHWWSYEDRNVDENAFLRNATAAAALDLDICTLDAGWFGPADAGTFWYDYRGDWNLVNEQRFPQGIRAVSEEVHRKGLKFGLWCEIEAVGKYAELVTDHPDYIAMRDGESLGYVCFGNPEVQDWAFATLDRLITEYRCDWIKLDFNLDPGAGCSRHDHGHGAGDGLYEHYQGYYRTLERIRHKHPNVVLESCSSGGLRIDLGLMRQTHTTFLSDPDWPEHSLQVFWGASTMLAPNVCLHWSYCDWLGDHPKQRFNPHDPQLTQHQLDYYTRIAMLGGFGFSQKLDELPDWVTARLIHHVVVYKQKVAQFVKEADLFRLTGQPKHDGNGDRWAAFQYSLPDRTEHLLFVFRLEHGEEQRTLRLRELEEDRLYTLTWLDDGAQQQVTGLELVRNGMIFDRLREEDSCLIHIV